MPASASRAGDTAEAILHLFRRRAFLGLIATGASARTGEARDFVPHPPAREVIASPNRHWALEISVDPRDLNGFAVATMRRDGARAWQRRLDAPIRPRFAVVADDGAAALFGCWQNVPADVSIEVLAPDGTARTRLDRPAIEHAVGVAVRDMADAVRHGVWLDRVPRIDGGMVRLGAAGRALVLDLASGQLQRVA